MDERTLRPTTTVLREIIRDAANPWSRATTQHRRRPPMAVCWIASRTIRTHTLGEQPSSSSYSSRPCIRLFFSCVEVGKPLQVVPLLFSQGCICCSKDLCICTLDAHSRIREVRLLQLLVASSNVSSFSTSPNGSSSSYSRFKAFRFTADIHCARVLAARAPASGVAAIRSWVCGPGDKIAKILDLRG